MPYVIGDYYNGFSDRPLRECADVSVAVAVDSDVRVAQDSQQWQVALVNPVNYPTLRARVCQPRRLRQGR